MNEIKIINVAVADSTNRMAMNTEQAEHLTAIVADRQTGGRGRLGRSFFSPEGGLYMSVILCPERVFCGTGFCTAAAALAAKDALCVFGFKF